MFLRDLRGYLHASAALLLLGFCLVLSGCGSSAGLSGSTSANASQTPTVAVNVSGPTGVALDNSVTFSAAVTGTTNTAVTWQVNGVVGGNSTSGTISTAGVYTAPVVMPSTSSVTVTAVSAASSSTKSSVTVPLLNPAPTASSGTATQQNGGSTFLLDVTGTGFLSGTALVANGAQLSTVYISSTELQADITLTATTALSVQAVTPPPGGGTSTAINVSANYVATTATPAAAARLLDQATFGPVLSDIQNVEQIGLQAYINQQMAVAPSYLANIPITGCGFTTLGYYECAQSEWWQNAVTAPDQLRQRVAFALSQILVVSTAQNTVSGGGIPPYHNILVQDAFGNFRDLMQDVTLSPTMGQWLNMVNNAKPANGQIANENYARELMQLFTIGTYELNQDGSLQLDGSGNPIPTYTQDQVQAFARAFTGWTWPGLPGNPPQWFPNGTVYYQAPMVSFDNAHDTAAKTLLNGTTLPAGQTAAEDLKGALDNIFQHPNVGPFVCRQLIQHLVKSNPSPAYVSRIAAVFANDGSGVRGDLKAVVQAILMDPEARAGDANPSDNGGHLREPVLFMTDMLRAFNFTSTAQYDNWYPLTSNSELLSEVPYSADTVFNFFPPDYYIPGTTDNAPEFGIENSATAVIRESLADSLVNNKQSGFTVDLSNTSSWGQLAANPSSLLDTLNVLLMHDQMPDAMRSAILTAITPLTSNAQRVRIAIYLIVTSPQYKIIH